MTPYLFIIICFLCHELAQRKQEIAEFTLISTQQISVCYSLQSPTLFKNAFYALQFSVHHFNLPVTQSTRVCSTVKKCSIIIGSIPVVLQVKTVSRTTAYHLRHHQQYLLYTVHVDCASEKTVMMA